MKYLHAEIILGVKFFAISKLEFIPVTGVLQRFANLLIRRNFGN